MRKYQEMNAEEKTANFGERSPALHIFWVLGAGCVLGYVYAIPLARAGRDWQATGARQAWIAVHRFGRISDSGTLGMPDYFPSKAAAAMGISAYEKHLGGKAV